MSFEQVCFNTEESYDIGDLLERKSESYQVWDLKTTFLV